MLIHSAHFFLAVNESTGHGVSEGSQAESERRQRGLGRMWWELGPLTKCRLSQHVVLGAVYTPTTARLCLLLYFHTNTLMCEPFKYSISQVIILSSSSILSNVYGPLTITPIFGPSLNSCHNVGSIRLYRMS